MGIDDLIRQMAGEYTDQSGTIAAGGTAQALMAANPTRHSAFVYNPGTDSLWINFLDADAAANGPGSVEIVPGQLLPFDARNAVSIVGATTGQAFTAGER